MAELSAMRHALQSGENVVPALQNLNTLLEATPSNSEILEIGSFVSLQLLFNCLSTTDEEQIKSCCAVLDKIFPCMPAADVSEYSQFIELGLQHFSADVKKLCLKTLKSNSSREPVQTVILTPTMFHLITQVVGDESLECAQLATEILLEKLTADNLGLLDVRLRQAFLLDLEGLMEKNETVCYRVYEIVVKMALAGGEVFTFVNSFGLLQRLVAELDSKDILVKLNCMELLGSLLDSSEGSQFLVSSQVLSKLHSQLISVQQDPLGGLIIPGIIKFFGHFSCSEVADVAAICSQYPEFLNVVLTAIHSPQDDTLWGITVDTFGLLGSTQAGREVLESYSVQVKDILSSLGNFIATASSDVRIRTLRAISMLMSCKEESSTYEGSMSREWFELLHPTIFPKLMSIMKQPFPDIRAAGLKLLLTIAQWEWGQREMHSQPGFLEYLLNRKTEPDKVGKELKYDIIHTLVISETAEGVFGSPGYLKLRQYDREGPFFHTADTSVALEGSL